MRGPCAAAISAPRHAWGASSASQAILRVRMSVVDRLRFKPIGACGILYTATHRIPSPVIVTPRGSIARRAARRRRHEDRAHQHDVVVVEGL